MEKKTIYTLKYLIDYFLRLEVEENLLSFEINGVKVWQYLRFRIFMLIATQTNVYKQAHTKNISFKYILKSSLSLLFYSIFSNPLVGTHKRKYLIFNNGRKTNVDGNLVDTVVDYFIISEGLDNYQIIEELVELKHPKTELKNRRHQDFQMILSFLRMRFSRFRLNDEQTQVVENIEKRLSADLSISISLKQLVRRGYLSFKSDYRFYLKLLENRKPDKVFIVCSYGYKMALVAALKKKNIESVELQHGTINPYHIGYRYPKSSKADYFPDIFYAFGDFWKQISDLPIEKDKIEIKGFPYFSDIKRKYNYVKQKKNQILIISQGSIGHYIVKLLFDGIQLFDSYNIVFKLHPGEVSRWKNEYPELVELSKLPNVEVVGDNTLNLYHYFAESEFVIGVYSTAIYEALGFGCNVILLNLPGIEYMEELINSKMVDLADDFNDIVKYLNTNARKINSMNIFADNNIS